VRARRAPTRLEVGGDPGGQVLELEAGDDDGQHEGGEAPAGSCRERRGRPRLPVADNALAMPRRLRLAWGGGIAIAQSGVGGRWLG
jgi:hypothetical protein